MISICNILGHNPERPYVCHVCLKGFKRKEHLNLHAVIHSGLKTEVCIAIRVFLDDFTIIIPSQICSECGKGFYRKDHLRKHIKSHLTKRAKEEAAHVNLQEPIGHEISIKREKLSPGSSPNSIQRTNNDSAPRTLSIPQFSLPQEVTIHVSSSIQVIL